MNKICLNESVLYTIAFIVSKDAYNQDGTIQTIKKQFDRALLQHNKIENNTSNIVLELECSENSDIKSIKVELKPTAYGEIKTVSEDQWVKINRSDTINLDLFGTYLISDQQFNKIQLIQGMDLNHLLKTTNQSYMIRQVIQKRVDKSY